MVGVCSTYRRLRRMSRRMFEGSLGACRDGAWELFGAIPNPFDARGLHGLLRVPQGERAGEPSFPEDAGLPDGPVADAGIVMPSLANSVPAPDPVHPITHLGVDVDASADRTVTTQAAGAAAVVASDTKGEAAAVDSAVERRAALVASVLEVEALLASALKGRAAAVASAPKGGEAAAVASAPKGGDAEAALSPDVVMDTTTPTGGAAAADSGGAAAADSSGAAAADSGSSDDAMGCLPASPKRARGSEGEEGVVPGSPKRARVEGAVDGEGELPATPEMAWVEGAEGGEGRMPTTLVWAEGVEGELPATPKMARGPEDDEGVLPTTPKRGRAEGEEAAEEEGDMPPVNKHQCTYRPGTYGLLYVDDDVDMDLGDDEEEEEVQGEGEGEGEEEMSEGMSEEMSEESGEGEDSEDSEDSEEMSEESEEMSEESESSGEIEEISISSEGVEQEQSKLQQQGMLCSNTTGAQPEQLQQAAAHAASLQAGEEAGSGSLGPAQLVGVVSFGPGGEVVPAPVVFTAKPLPGSVQAKGQPRRVRRGLRRLGRVAAWSVGLAAAWVAYAYTEDD